MKKQKVAAVFVLMTLGGCVTVPNGPSVNVLPTKGKSFETFLKEDETCRQWAKSQLGAPVQETYNQNVATGAVVGTAVGTGVGAALGSASGHAGAGAVIGAATGLLLGSAAGSGSAQVYGAQAQRQYDNAYVQCMYTYGNQIPQSRQTVAARPPVTAPPPVAPPPPVVASPPPPPPPVAAPPVIAPPPRAPERIVASPPEEYEAEPPEFIYSPRLDAYVAVGVPYELVYTGNEYFYYSGGNWYRGAYYNGPWSYVPRTAYPPVFVRYEVVNIRHYRDVEYRRYARDRVRYDGRVYRPQYRRVVRYRPGH